ncbi:MAG TPA: hypothetical protein VJ941_08165 [Gracilimonas sp.]|nr:hypothetical protein [Gracilimonas sp.]
MYSATVYVKVYSCILIMCVFISCSENKLNYLSKIKKIDEFEYTVLNEWKEVYKDSLKVQSWYSSGNDSTYFISRLSNIEEINEQKFWVYDYIQGKVFEFNEEGLITNEILETGKGPQEVLKPFSIDRYIEKEDTLVYVFDGGNKSIIKLNTNGNELGRVYSESITERMMDAQVEILNVNSFIYPNYSTEKYSLIEFDSAGNFKKGWVNRLVPLGKQPVTYNDVAFLVNQDQELFIYSYQGLPLVFVTHGNRKFVLNLEPKVEISSINTPLEFKEENEGLAVKKLIRTISTIDDYILVNYLSELILIPFDKNNRIIRYKLIDENGNLLKFHFMEVTQNYIFLINGFKGKMYRLKKNNLTPS